MNAKKKLPIIALLLVIACFNFSRLPGNEVIRPIQYLSLLAIGALAGLLLREIIVLLRTRKQ